jgi:hypothetical protein
MALDKLTLLDETIINTTATTVATNVVNNSAQTNYISFPVATSNPLTNGWRVYSDGASHSPVDGTGGSPNSTLTQNTTPPVLNSTGDFRLTKSSGASRQGEGISTDFTIATRHLGKVLQISFDYEIIGATTLATDDLRVYIVQNPSGTPVVIEPVNVGIQGTVTGVRLRHLATFQTDISITSYRLCIHIKTTTNSAQTIDFNNFRVWETTQSVGSVITDWQSYTPTIQGGGTLTNVSVRWRRIGGSVEIQGKLTLGTVSSSEFQLSLPNGITISPIVSTTNHRVGQINYTRPTGDPYGVQFVLLASSSHSYLGHSGYYQNQLDGRSQGDQLTRRNADYLLETGGTISFQAEVPIAGWGSSVAMSSDTGDGRVVACQYRSINSGTSSTTQPINYATREYDTHNAVTLGTPSATYASGNAWKFTAPISGIYRVSASSDGSSGQNIRCYVNGIARTYTGLGIGNNGGGTTSVSLNSGDILDVRTDSSMTVSGDAGRSISIERISAGSQVIATTETVACRYVSTSGQTIGTDTVVTFATRVTDTHGAYNTTTGIFTAPMSGWYNVGANLVLNTNNLTFIEIQQNSTTRLTYQSFPSNRGIATTSVYLLSGETLRIRASANTSTSLSTISGDNSINFYRVGV